MTIQCKLMPCLSHWLTGPIRERSGQPTLSRTQEDVGTVYGIVPNAVLCDRRRKKRRFVQHNIADCSFVASLIVLSRHDELYGTSHATSPLQLTESGPPATGLHRVRMKVNGTWREVRSPNRITVAAG